MRIALIIVRSLMGLLFLFSSITFLFKLITLPELTGAMKIFSEGLGIDLPFTNSENN
jgi:putative oxidoreductase